MTEVYYEFAGLLAASVVAGVVAVGLRQPMIIAFIAVGILVGPAAFGLVTAHDQVELLAEIGVTVLLFVVGLKLDVNLIRSLGRVALATGLGQLAFTIVFGFFIALSLGMPAVKALYVAVALTFSSTIIIVKLLSDKREIDSLHGRIAMGFLIVQDLAVVIALLVLGAELGVGVADAAGALVLLQLVLKLAAALALVAGLMRYVLPRLLHLVARSQELLLIFAVAWGTLLATFGEMVGFSKEVGALLAGFSLASTAYREAIATRLVSVRDFLLLFFFVNLGTKLDLRALGDDLSSALVLSVFVLVGNPLIVMAIMGWMGYRKRTGFLAGLTVAQISEFSIVFIAMGVTLGHVDQSALGLVTLVGLVTIALSTYMILYSDRLYTLCVPVLGVFERRRPFREIELEDVGRVAEAVDVIVFGVGRYGRRLMERLQELGVRTLGVDFDPEVVHELRRRGMDLRFGDIEDPDFPETLPLLQARSAVSTIPNTHLNLGLVAALRRHGFAGPIVMTAHHAHDRRRLAAAGVDRILEPFADAADFAARAIAKSIAS
jgi:Kef-type K+ transport system membrane component KefB